MGGRQAQRHLRAARAPERRRVRGAGREPARAGTVRLPCTRADRRGGGGKPALRRGDDRDADRRRPARVATTEAGATATSPGRDPTVDPGPARRPARPPRARGAARRECALGRGQGLPPRARSPRWPPSRVAATRQARHSPEGADPPRPPSAWRRARIPLPSPAHPRRGLRVASQGARSDLHERFVGWLERKTVERPGEYDEIVGYHLEQAYRLRMQLGIGDDASAGSQNTRAPDSRRGSTRAGARGRGGGREPARARQCRCSERTEPERLELMLSSSKPFEALGNWRGPAALLDEVVADAEAQGDERIRMHAELHRLVFRRTLIRNARPTNCRRAMRAFEVFERAGDEPGLAMSCHALAEVHLTHCRWDDAKEGSSARLPMPSAQASRAGDPDPHLPRQRHLLGADPGPRG